MYQKTLEGKDQTVTKHVRKEGKKVEREEKRRVQKTRKEGENVRKKLVFFCFCFQLASVLLT